MATLPRVILQKGKERSVKNFHPWIFSGAIQTIEKGLKEGDVADVYSASGEYLATGHYHEGSIKMRLFSFQQTDASYPFWLQRITEAYEFRKSLGLTDNTQTSAYRLVHAEGDSLPGLIIDIYGFAAVMQTHSLGMHRSRTFIVQALQEVYGENLQLIYDKSADALARQHNMGVQDEFLLGSGEAAVVEENGLKFYVNWVEGQKTGFFIDQRENRKLLGSYSRNKSVLNAFSYSGGFSVYALAGRASNVHSLDSSRRAADWAGQNVSLNFTEAPHQFYQQDVFEFLKSTDEKYDIVVLDPPGFAKHLSSIDKASRGYRNLNVEGIRKVARNGLLFTFSCSQVIDKTLFRKLVFQAAAECGRPARILHQLTQPADHPINIYHPEGEYLKGLVLKLD